MTTLQKYELRPLDSWAKAVELKNQRYEECWRAREKGKLLGFSVASRSNVLPAAFSRVELCEASSYTLTLSKNSELARACAKAVEGKGHFSDWCSHLRLLWGSMILNRGPYGEFPKPDFILQMHYCEAIAKTDQLIAEYVGCPYFCIDLPLIPPGQKREGHLQFLVDQFQDAIEFMERLTGQPCDDGKLLEAARNEWECRLLFCRLLELQKNIPAPLDQRMIYTLSAPIFLLSHRREAVDFYRMLIDEVEYRVKHQIAASAYEQCRLIHDGLPVLHYLRLYRIPQLYGATFIAETYHLAQPSGYEALEDGTWVIPPPPWEQGNPMRTREDALRALALWYLINPAFHNFLVGPRPPEMLRLVRDWKVQGVVFHLNRGCQGLTAGAMESRLALQAQGIPCLTYEANSGEAEGFSEPQIIDRFESFLEMLGLKRLEA